MRGRSPALHRPVDRRAPELEAGALALRISGQAKNLMHPGARAKRDAFLRRRAAPPPIMGILNLTPYSFSDGGRFASAGAGVAHAAAMVAAGCDVIDVGGESTRPDAVAVPASEERARIGPVLARLANEVAVSIS